MRPLIKWSGGKRTEIEKFRDFYPKDYKRYIEAFVGGGAVFFDLQPKKAVLSDAHEELTNFYQQMKDGHGPAMHSILVKVNNDEKTYYYMRDEYSPSNQIEEAARFFYLRKTCFRGMLRYNSKGKFNIPFGRYKTYNIEELIDPNYCQVFNGTTIVNWDFKDVFAKYNSPDNFVFLDPPYDSTFKNYGRYDFSKQDHQDLADIFRSTKNKCLLVISETDFISGLYKGYVKHKYPKKYAFKIHSNRVGSEIDKNHLVITNY